MAYVLASCFGFFVDVECYAAVSAAAEHVGLVFVFEKAGFVGFAVGMLLLMGASANVEDEEDDEDG